MAIGTWTVYALLGVATSLGLVYNKIQIDGIMTWLAVGMGVYFLIFRKNLIIGEMGALLFGIGLGLGIASVFHLV